MTFNIDIWHGGSSWHSLGRIRRSRSQHENISFFSAVNAVGGGMRSTAWCYSDWLFIEFLCAKLVGATSSEGFLVYTASGSSV